MRPEYQLKSRTVPEFRRDVVWGCSEITKKTLKREMELVAVTEGGSIMSYYNVVMNVYMNQ